MSVVTSFTDLSRVLLGDPTLPEALGDDLERLLRAAHGAALDAMLVRWAERPTEVLPQQWLSEQLWAAEPLKTLCKDVASSWLFGAPFRGGKVVDTLPTDEAVRSRAHFQGRFWEYVHAHPPGLSGGYFGHWMYPAER